MAHSQHWIFCFAADESQNTSKAESPEFISKLMASLKTIVTFLLLAFSIADYGQSTTTSNKIDSLRTDKEVFAFVRQFFQNYDGREIFDYYRNETRKVADSFQVRNWVKVDIDNNGETDLLVFRADKLPKIIAILCLSGKFKAISAKFNNCKYQFMYPVVTTLNKKNIILLYNQEQIDYDRNTKHFIYTEIICDTLLVKEGVFVNYLLAPIHHDIEKIEIFNDGDCEGDCPRINISINTKTYLNKCTKELHWFNKPRIFNGQLNKEEINQIVKLLNNSDFLNINDSYKVDCTDQTTTTLTITFNNGKTKVINDYGSSGNFTLAEIYNIAYGINWVEDKGNR